MPRPALPLFAGDGTVEDAARQMGLRAAEFQKMLPALLERGFPRPDPTTGMLDLDAIAEWRRQRHPRLYGLTPAPAAKDAASVVRDRLGRIGCRQGGGA